MACLVTGGEGFIGQKIVSATAGSSFDLKSGQDVLNKELLQNFAKQKEGIFHCAAKISVPESFQLEAEYYRNNVDGMRSVIAVAEQVGAKIVFSSSAAVYGESNAQVKEEAILKPQSPYAENKKEGEELLQQSIIPHIALRYFNVYGPGQSKQYAGVISIFIDRALKGEDLVITGDGQQVRDFIFVNDVVAANTAAMAYQNDSFEVFNIASGQATTITVLAETIIALTNSPSKIIYEEPRPGDIVYSLADVSKARTTLNWQATVSLEEGLRKTIESFKR